MTLWFEDAPNAHYHLGAFSREGYEVSASYALFVVARGRRVRWVDLGGAPGTGSEDGLMRFKRDWASGERIANLCSRAMDRNAYAALASRGGGARTTWFPRYRGAERDLAGASWGYDDESSTG